MRTPYFAALPDACLVDETLPIRVGGVQEGDRVRVRLASAGAPGSIWLAESTFLATAADVDLSRDAPVCGSYEGVDPMGLFWSRAAAPVAEAQVAADRMTVTLSAAIEGAGGSAPHRVRRSFSADAVRQRDVREEGIVARLFEPAEPGPHPAVLER